MENNCLIKSSNGLQLVTLTASLLSKRIIFLDDEINDDTSLSIMKQMIHLMSEDNTTPISLIIDSPGGELASGMLLYDFIQGCACPIDMYCLKAYSMAGVLFLSGKRRFVFENSTIMLHEPLIGKHNGGSASEIKELSNKLIEKAESISEIISKHTGKSIKEVKHILKKDTYFTSKEAIDWNLADEIIEIKQLVIDNA